MPYSSWQNKRFRYSEREVQKDCLEIKGKRESRQKPSEEKGKKKRMRVNKRGKNKIIDSDGHEPTNQGRKHSRRWT